MVLYVLEHYVTATSRKAHRVKTWVRSVQRLVLIMPVKEMSAPVVVKEYEHYVQCAVHV